jgi:hypothetical protein
MHRIDVCKTLSSGLHLEDNLVNQSNMAKSPGHHSWPPQVGCTDSPGGLWFGGSFSIHASGLCSSLTMSSGLVMHCLVHAKHYRILSND